MRLLNLFILSVITLLVTSCMTGRQNDRLEQDIDKTVKSPASWASQSAENRDVSDTWLESFNDPMMLKLIAEGKANNIDLQIAAGNMDKAWLLARQSGVALKPAVDLSLGAKQSGSADGGPTNKNISAGLQVSWELDIWGRIRAGVDAAEAQAQAVEADYIFAQHSLSANIAKTYFKVIEAKLQAAITRKNLSILQKTMRITQVKYDNGLSSAQDVALNRANVASAQEQLIAIEGSQRDALRGLEVLLGRYPRADLDIGRILPSLPPPPPAGIPSELLERRPDIVSAERQIAAAFDATDQAKAARLPKFSLTSGVNGASNSLSDMLSPTNVAWQLASNLIAPLFDGGKRKIDVEIATLEQNQAISNYAQTALTAFSEVETNLDQGLIMARRVQALKEVQSQSNEAYRIAQLRYKEGESDLLDTLQIQQQAIAAESQLSSIRRDQLEQRINLYLALGGDW